MVKESASPELDTPSTASAPSTSVSSANTTNTAGMVALQELLVGQLQTAQERVTHLELSRADQRAVFEQVILAMNEKTQRQAEEITALKAQVVKYQAQMQTLRSTLDEVTASKDAEIASLRKKMQRCLDFLSSQIVNSVEIFQSLEPRPVGPCNGGASSKPALLKSAQNLLARPNASQSPASLNGSLKMPASSIGELTASSQSLVTTKSNEGSETARWEELDKIPDFVPQFEASSEPVVGVDSSTPFIFAADNSDKLVGSSENGLAAGATDVSNECKTMPYVPPNLRRQFDGDSRSISPAPSHGSDVMSGRCGLAQMNADGGVRTLATEYVTLPLGSSRTSSKQTSPRLSTAGDMVSSIDCHNDDLDVTLAGDHFDQHNPAVSLSSLLNIGPGEASMFEPTSQFFSTTTAGKTSTAQLNRALLELATKTAAVAKENPRDAVPWVAAPSGPGERSRIKRTGYCDLFNNTPGGCTFPQCKFSHTCLLCESPDHPCSLCPQYESFIAANTRQKKPKQPTVVTALANLVNSNGVGSLGLSAEVQMAADGIASYLSRQSQSLPATASGPSAATTAASLFSHVG